MSNTDNFSYPRKEINNLLIINFIRNCVFNEARVTSPIYDKCVEKKYPLIIEYLAFTLQIFLQMILITSDASLRHSDSHDGSRGVRVTAIISYR